MSRGSDALYTGGSMKVAGRGAGPLRSKRNRAYSLHHQRHHHPFNGFCGDDLLSLLQDHDSSDDQLPQHHLCSPRKDTDRPQPHHYGDDVGDDEQQQQIHSHHHDDHNTDSQEISSSSTSTSTFTARKKSTTPRVNTGGGGGGPKRPSTTHCAAEEIHGGGDVVDHDHHDHDHDQEEDLEGEAVVLVQKIGQGSCGAVYLGHHPRSRRDYAVKLIPKDDQDQRTPRLLKRVRLEGELLLMLDHPHIVRGYGVMETESHAFLFMEHAQGGDLLEFVNREGPLSESRARRMFRQVVRAVRHLHRHGWVHRDIKPENIFIAFDEEDDNNGSAHDRHEVGQPQGHQQKQRKGGEDSQHDNVGEPPRAATPRGQGPRKMRLVLGDMGFARQWSPNKQMQECVGTFPYAAPEVINRESYVGPEADSWSLGVVLLAMLTAQMPFGATTDEESRALAAAGRFVVPPGLSDAALELLSRILQPDPARRLSVEGIWRHPWLRNKTPSVIGPSSASARSCGNSSTYNNNGAELLTTSAEQHKPRQQHQPQPPSQEAVEPQAAPSKTTTKKRSRVRRAASLLFRRTANAIAEKKRGRSSSNKATAPSSTNPVSA